MKTLKILKKRVHKFINCKDLLFFNNDIDWHLDDGIRHIAFLKGRHYNFKNTSFITCAFGLVKIRIFFTLSIFLISIFTGLVFIEGSMKMFYEIIQTIVFGYLSDFDRIRIVFITLIPITFFLIGLISLIDSFKIIPSGIVYNELFSRYRELLKHKNIEQFTLCDIKSCLRPKTLKPNSDLESFSVKNISTVESSHIHDKRIFALLIDELNNHPEFGDELVNRIGAYFYDFKIISAPISCKTQIQLVEFWKSINGGRGAIGSSSLIKNPTHNRGNKIANIPNIIASLKIIKLLFQRIGFQKGVEKVNSDIITISGITKVKSKHDILFNTNRQENA